MNRERKATVIMVVEQPSSANQIIIRHPSFWENKLLQDHSVYDPSTDKGGECAGTYLIYSPQGKANPSTVFCHPSDALKTASSMKKQFGETWYIAKLETVE